jgi:YHS domain-containing protein
MARFFLFAILAWIAYFLVKKIGKAFFAPSDPRDRQPGAVPDAELIQDPQCGAYFMKQKGIKGVVDGKVMHFCSEECYDKYLKRHRRT